MPFVAGLSGSELSDQLDRLALDDLYLAAACAEGDENAWRELEAKHFAFIRDFAARVLTRGSAEDVAAQVIADLWQRKKIAQFEGRSTLRTWLGTVVTRAALNAAAKLGEESRRRELDISQDIGSPQRGAEPAVTEDARLLARLIGRAIEELADEDKLLLYLYYEQGLTLEQIEPTLRTSKATLSRRLKRIREQVRVGLATLIRAETGEASLDTLRAGLSRAGLEFDLGAALGDSLRLLQGNRRGDV